MPEKKHENSKDDIEAMRQLKLNELSDKLYYKTDFNLLYAQKQTLLNAIYTGSMPPKEAMEGLVNFLDLMGDIGETVGRFQYEDIEPPFPLHPDYVKHEYSFPEEQEKVYILLEEREDEFGFFTSENLAMSHDKEALRTLLYAKLEKNEYGLFSPDDVADRFSDIYESEYQEGIGKVSYYISDEKVLNTEQIKAKLKEPEYDTTTKLPDNIREFLKPHVNHVIKGRGLILIDIDKALDTILADYEFLSEIKRKDLDGNYDLESNEYKYKQNEFIEAMAQFLEEKEDNWFVSIGSAEEPTFPKDMKKLVVEAIYDVCKKYLKPVYDVNRTANNLMHTQDFIQAFATKDKTPLSKLQQDDFNIIVGNLENMVANYIVPEVSKAPNTMNFHDTVLDAQRRAAAQTSEKSQPSKIER